MRFTVLSEGHDELNLRQTFEEFANNLWIPDHLSEKQAAEFALDCFRRAFLMDLDMLRVVAEDERPIVVGGPSEHDAAS